MSDASPARPRPAGPDTLPAGAWRAPRMVRFSDCDPAGIVYTPRFVDMINGVIEDFFPEALGLDYHAILRGGVGLGYAKLDCDFFSPGLMGDRLEVAVVVGRIGGASAHFTVHIHRGDDELLRCRLVMVSTSLASKAAIPLPPAVREALTAYQDRCR